jgi:hypothetical protein
MGVSWGAFEHMLRLRCVCTNKFLVTQSIGSAACAGLAVAQREALRLVPLKVVMLMRLAAVASRVARDAAPQPLAALACADAAAGERAHRAARPRRRAALAASMRALVGVVMLRSWLQLSN